jgi:hypothetical protein
VAAADSCFFFLLGAIGSGQVSSDRIDRISWSTWIPRNKQHRLDLERSISPEKTNEESPERLIGKLFQEEQSASQANFNF